MNANSENIKLQTETSDRDIYKRKLIHRYFYEYKHHELSKLDIRLVFMDNNLLKTIMLPKSVYRTYFLSLRTMFSEERIPISIKDKDEIKEMLYEINSKY